MDVYGDIPVPLLLLLCPSDMFFSKSSKNRKEKNISIIFLYFQWKRFIVPTPSTKIKLTISTKRLNMCIWTERTCANK